MENELKMFSRIAVEQEHRRKRERNKEINGPPAGPGNDTNDRRSQYLEAGEVEMTT